MKAKSTLIAGIVSLALLLPGVSLAQCSLSFTYTVTESRCKSTGAIHVEVTGGSGSYNYKLSGGSIPSINTSSKDITGLPAGTYRLEVRDVVDGCTYSQEDIVVPGSYQDPRFSLSATDVTCIGGSDGSITVINQQYGRGPFIFSIVAPSASGVGTTNTTGVFTNLVPGSYSIRLADSCGGLQTRVITIADYNWWIETHNVARVGCDSADVSITLKDNHSNLNTSGSAFSGFTYGVSRTPGDTVWSSSRNFRVFKGSSHTLTLVAKDGCGHTKTVVWNEPKPSVDASISKSNFLCSGFTATVTGKANLANPQFCLYNSSNVLVGCNTTGVFSNIAYGSYTIRINDACYDTTITRTVSHSQPTPTVAANVSTSNLACSTFSATVTGQQNLTSPTYCIYDQSDVQVACNNTGIFNNLPYGTYTIRITDGCTGAVITRTVTGIRPVPSVNPNPTITYNCSNFNLSWGGLTNLNNAQFCLYDGDGNLIDCRASGNFNNLPYGSYCLNIINNAGCYDTTIVRCFTVSPRIPQVAANMSYTNQQCSTYTASVGSQQNLSNPNFCLYDNTNTLIMCNTNGVFAGLSYNVNYTVRITNDAACYDTVIVRNFSRTRPIPNVAGAVSVSNRSCSTFRASVTGQANLTNPTYCLYDANDAQVDCNNTGVFNNVPYGSYTIRIVNTCYDTTIVRTVSASPTVMNPNVSAAASCSIGNTDLSASWTATVAPYTINIYNPGNVLVYTTTTSSTSATINGIPGLPGGLQYRFEIRDNCNGVASVNVTPHASWLNKSINANSKCPGGQWQNGSGDLNISAQYSHGAVTPKIIRKNGSVVNISANTVSGINFTFSEMEPAEYVIEYTLQGCSGKVYDTFQLQSYTFPNLQQSAVYQCNDNNFSVSSAVTGGLAPFTYEIIGSIPDSPSIVMPPQTNPVFSISNNSTYGLIRLRSIDACGNATTNDASVLPLANTSISATSNCFYNNITLSVDTIPNATYTWYKKTSPTDSILIGNGLSYNIPYLMPEDTGVYVCAVSVNSGCLTRESTFYVNGLCGVVLQGNSLGFTAKLQGNDAVLSWVTDKDFNADAFEVQWSTDGVHFTALGIVNAFNSGSSKQYQYAHTAVATGKNYYRLKILKNGKQATYSVVAVVSKLAGGQGVRVYPNPVDSYFDIQFKDISAGNHKVSLVAADGRVVWESTLLVQSGQTKRIARPATAVSGNYMLVIQSAVNGERKVINMIFR
jgi:hypothetical protein